MRQRAKWFIILMTRKKFNRFEGECGLLGYSDYTFSGSSKVTLLSQNEEINAAIILTVMTILLAFSFVMVRKWI